MSKSTKQSTIGYHKSSLSHTSFHINPFLIINISILLLSSNYQSNTSFHQTNILSIIPTNSVIIHDTILSLFQHSTFLHFIHYLIIIHFICFFLLYSSIISSFFFILLNSITGISFSFYVHSFIHFNILLMSILSYHINSGHISDLNVNHFLFQL